MGTEKKLYEVKMEHLMYVVADSSGAAEQEALYHVGDQEPEYVSATEITAENTEHITVPFLDSIPFGNQDTELTVRQWMDAIDAPREPQPELSVSDPRK